MANYFDGDVKVGALASIEVSSRGTHTYIGAGTFIDDFVKVKHVAGDGNVTIGKRVYINSGTVIYSANGVAIGNDVLIGPNCNIVPVNHNILRNGTPMRLQGYPPSKGGITIEDDVWIAAGVTVLDGVTIARGSVVGAGAIVTKDTEPYSINIGNPSRKIGSRQDSSS